jgi:hypothetical protein
LSHRLKPVADTGRLKPAEHGYLLPVNFSMLLPLTLLAMCASPWESQLAQKDRQNFPAAEWGYLYYLSTAAAPAELREPLARTAAFVVASASRAVVVERQLPVRVGESDLYRIDLRQLEWSWRDWQTVLARYPYSPGQKLPLVVRADWLVVELTDAFASDSYYRLLYGERNIPKTRDDFLKFWQVEDDPAFRFGLIEGRSGVALAGIRWIENRPTANRGYAWGTRDSAEIDANTDPLERPDGSFRHQAEEWIVGIPKWSAAGPRGTLQAYLLANGQGERQDRAPADIVADQTRFRGLPEIRTCGSCLQCHATGIKGPKENQLRGVIAAGVDLYADRRTQEALERFHLADVEKEVLRNREDYAAGVQLVTGHSAEENAAAFKRCIDWYERDVTREQAARELGVSPGELRLALGYASARNLPLGARLNALAHDAPLPRSAWEDAYATAYAAVKLWRSAGRTGK